jgi:hypothetical protein
VSGAIRPLQKYSACNSGHIYSNINNKYLIGTDNGRGYLRVSLMTPEGLKKYEYVHRLVAKAFLLEEDHSLTVDHINNDKRDNKPGNLQFMTRRENSLKACLVSTIPSKKRH